MPCHQRAIAAITLAILIVPTTAGAQDRQAAGALSFDREIKPILRKRCANCHNTERPRGELDLTTFAGLAAGGAGGKAAIPGNPDESPLYTLAAHVEDPKMPPNAPKIPQKEIDSIRRWIEGGMVEKAGDSPAGPKAPVPTLVAPETPPHLTAISALAVSPSAPLVAASGHHQVLVFDLAGRKTLGALPFSEGDVFALKFSRDGRTLLASGGIGAESGKAVLFRVEDWSRASAVGDEVDVVLASDLSPDGSRVAIGGPGRVVKVIANPGGEVVHTFRKPTDWVTTLAFSPDGLLIAAGDRFGGLFLWEVRSGKEFLSLKGHPKAITSIGWDVGGDRLVTAGEDGAIQAWDLHAGKVAARWEAHEGGVLSVAVHPDGRIASGGRDRRVKVWGPDGGLVHDLGTAPDEVTRLAWGPDGRSLVSGDLSGEVRVWDPADSSSTRLPMPVASRPAVVALVEPVLAPARPFAPRPVAVASKTAKPASAARPGDDLEAALVSAREAASAAERTVAGLARLARAGTEGSSGTGDALNSAIAAEAALRAALAAEPGDAGLIRALEETGRAVKLLEQKRGGRLNAATGGGR